MGAAAAAAAALIVIGAAGKGRGTGAGSVSMVRRLPPLSTRMTPATTTTMREAGGTAAVKTVTLGAL